MSRIQSVDTFRVIAMIAVITVHTTPFSSNLPRNDELYKYLSVLTDQGLRFAVPFFFVISGYFWGLKVRDVGNPISLANSKAKKIAIIFLVWSLIYLLPYNITAIYEYGMLNSIKVVYWNIIDLAKDPVRLLMEGTKVHLWFFIGLIFSLYISALFVQKGMIKSLIVIAILLYIFGLLARAYVNTPIGIEVKFNTRNGPFFAMLPFTSGYCISGMKIDTKWLRYGLILFSFGLVLRFSELYILWKYYATTPYQEYVAGSYFMGLGVAVTSLSNPKFFQVNALSKIGRLNLGIYAIHCIFLDIFGVIDKKVDSRLWDISYVFIVSILSVISVVLLAKNKIIRQIVT